MICFCTGKVEHKGPYKKLIKIKKWIHNVGEHSPALPQAGKRISSADTYPLSDEVEERVGQRSVAGVSHTKADINAHIPLQQVQIAIIKQVAVS